MQKNINLLIGVGQDPRKNKCAFFLGPFLSFFRIAKVFRRHRNTRLIPDILHHLDESSNILSILQMKDQIQIYRRTYNPIQINGNATHDQIFNLLFSKRLQKRLQKIILAKSCFRETRILHTDHSCLSFRATSHRQIFRTQSEQSQTLRWLRPRRRPQGPQSRRSG